MNEPSATEGEQRAHFEVRGLNDGLSPNGSVTVFAATSLSMALSSIASANGFLELGVLVFERLQALASEIPSPLPAVLERSIAMICSSVKLIRFIRPSPRPYSNSAWRRNSVAGQQELTFFAMYCGSKNDLAFWRSL